MLVSACWPFNTVGTAVLKQFLMLKVSAYLVTLSSPFIIAMRKQTGAFPVVQTSKSREVHDCAQPLHEILTSYVLTYLLSYLATCQSILSYPSELLYSSVYTRIHKSTMDLTKLRKMQFIIITWPTAFLGKELQDWPPSTTFALFSEQHHQYRVVLGSTYASGVVKLITSTLTARCNKTQSPSHGFTTFLPRAV